MGSLFAGIGGLDLGVEVALTEAGLSPRVLWQVEQKPFCRLVLDKHWPEADRRITDVRKASAQSLPRPHLVIGGFPCQDLSGAGKGAGLSGARSGLWYEYRRYIAEAKPLGAIVENVASGKSRWLRFVVEDLEALGYDVTWTQLGACDVGAPHERQRVFVLALAHADGLRERPADAEEDPQQAAREAPQRRGARSGRGRGASGPGSVADADGIPQQEGAAGLSREERGGRPEPRGSRGHGGDVADAGGAGCASVRRRRQLDRGEREAPRDDAHR
jgi:DNA (cytosine-5)-methyltransferase 1